jgi:hypothetical protein
MGRSRCGFTSRSNVSFNDMKLIPKNIKNEPPTLRAHRNTEGSTYQSIKGLKDGKFKPFFPVAVWYLKNLASKPQYRG